MELFREILKLNEKYNLIENNDTIVVGFSGGPDSVFLVEMLKKLQDFFKFKIYLVHINHLLRGEDADADESFSYDYAKRNNLEIFVKRIPVKEIAKKIGKTLEEVGREERYNFFSEIYNKVGANKIATAHNKDDQIETFLFRLVRGTSLQGLEGIKLKYNNIIRPISEIYKKDILEYLNKNEIQYKIDKTNFENEFTRNSIRLDLIPFIEKRYNAKFKDKIFSLIEEIRENNQNNSLNLKHRYITLDFLKNESYEKIIYVLNCGKLGTNEEMEYLTWLANNIDKSKVIFVLNKVDILTKEDNLSESIRKLQFDLNELGFQSGKIYPIMAYPALLFKLEKFNEYLNDDEIDELELYKRRIHRDYYDLSRYIDKIDDINMLYINNTGILELEKIIFS